MSTLDRHIMRTYARQPVTLVRGEGLYAWDETGKRYMDLLGGIAVNALGHCHPSVVQAVQAQAATLMHTSNLFHTHPQNQLAEALISTTSGKFDRIFFSNSGAEANEAALKVARKFGKLSGNANKTKIVTALNSFHGRTFGTLYRHWPAQIPGAVLAFGAGLRLYRLQRSRFPPRRRR